MNSDAKDAQTKNSEGLPKATASLPEVSTPPGDFSGSGNARSPALKKLIVAIAVGAIGVGASFMSCVGQSFHLRQAQALEGIEQQLKGIRETCPASPFSPAPSSEPLKKEP